jgi:hypothetical protein
MSPIGTFRTWRIEQTMSVVEGEPDLIVTRADVWKGHFSDVADLTDYVGSWGVRSTGQCNTAFSLSAGASKPKVFRGR